MAKLHQHELDWVSIIKEAFIWLPLLFIWCWAETTTIQLFVYAREWTNNNYWFHRILPCAGNGGWFTLSFVSTVTGLNLAIVKLQSFLKSQEDAQTRWINEAITRAFERHPELGADEPSAEKFKQSVRQRSRMLVDEYNASNLQYWAMLNRNSVRATIMGFLCLIFGYSAGFLGIFMLVPVIFSWILGRFTAEYLYTQMDTVCNLAVFFTNQLKEQSGRAGGELSEKLRKAAVPELPLSTARSP